MESLFVFDGYVWWLKITDEKQLLKYYENTASKWEDAMDQDGSSLAFAIKIHAQANGISLMESALSIRESAMKNQMNSLADSGAIFINRKGGFCTKIENYTQWVRRKDMIFPDYTNEDIRIKRFIGGHHWYAYIGDMQLKNGKEEKWENYDDAYAVALNVIGKR